MAPIDDLHAQIASEKVQRIHDFQTDVMASKRMGMRLDSAAQVPLKMFAQGDSWFDYPLPHFPIRTDIIPHLKQCPGKPHILSLAHYGEATEDMMGTKKRDELITQISNPPTGRFDAILFSGGGNDLAGDQFRLWLV